MTLVRDRRRKRRQRGEAAVERPRRLPQTPIVEAKPASLAQRKLIDKLLARRPLVRMHVQSKLANGLNRQEASDLIDQLRRS